MNAFGDLSRDTGPFGHFALLASDFAGSTARTSTIARTTSPGRRIDQPFFLDNNNVMVEPNFRRS
jgi:hypothetical protein